MMLGIVGGWLALTFGAFIGYPWPAQVHLYIYVICIGVGAGTGAYCGWISLSVRWYVVVTTILVIMAGGVIGSYVGNNYWDAFIDMSYMGVRDTRVNATHWGAAIGASVVATMLGLYFHFRTRG